MFACAAVAVIQGCKDLPAVLLQDPATPGSMPGLPVGVMVKLCKICRAEGELGAGRAEPSGDVMTFQPGPWEGMGHLVHMAGHIYIR